jgi:3-hydroxybutyryl-CoA dehydrogenase
MHWFFPANIMKVIEVVWTSDTTEETIQLIEAMCDKLGKTHLRVKDVPGDMGHVGNRVYYAAREEARKIIEQGICTAEGVDAIMTGGFNWPMGPVGNNTPNRTGWNQKK